MLGNTERSRVVTLKFGNLDKMRITSSEPKDNPVILGKGLITSLGLKSKTRQINTKWKGMPLEMSV